MTHRTAPNEPIAQASDAGFDRRSLLMFGGATAAIGFVGAPGSAVSAAMLRPIRYVVTDRRHPESLAFGRALAADGAVRLEVTDGLTRIWQEALLPHWRGAEGAVAGITAPGVWQGLAEQARSEARRSSLIGRHTVGAITGLADHRVAAPANPLDGFGADAWPLAMAALVRRCSSAGPGCGREWRGGTPMAPDSPHRSLITWTIA